jgi:vitamin B12/bleomycin/antimicrobial peptide transport system ATP-binding/permease protein
VQQNDERSVQADTGVNLADDSFFLQIRGMVAAFWASRQAGKLFWLGFLLVGVVSATAYGQICLNAWNQPFYDALAGKDMPAFLKQIGVFAGLAGLLLVLNVSQVWLKETTKVTLREGLVHDLVNEWLVPMRAFRLLNAGDMGANPDQRIHEDARHLTELTTELGIGLLQSTLLLLSFIGVLWMLSSALPLSIGGVPFVLPGYMVLCAVFYACMASFLSWLVGRPLIHLNANRYAREAELRFALVRISEEIDGITLYAGEADEKLRLEEVFHAVIKASRGVVTSLTRLSWVTAGYGWFTIVAPIIVAAPIYFYSDMSIGQLMTIVGAFNQVQQALRWFVDNFSVIADWRATLLRVADFRKIIQKMDIIGENISGIAYIETDKTTVSIFDLVIAAPETSIRLSESHIELNAGEHVLVSGEIGSEKTLVFNALAGHWPWGTGQIYHPERKLMMFMPARAYIPPGTLLAAITYPRSADDYIEAHVLKALADVGLERLQPLLNTSDRWDRILNADEKQCLAFARVILQRPQWVILNEVFELMDPLSRSRIQALFKHELPEVGMISISSSRTQNGFFSRGIKIMTGANGPVIKPIGHKMHRLNLNTRSKAG